MKIVKDGVEVERMFRVIKIEELDKVKNHIGDQAYEKIKSNTVERLECLEGFDLIGFDWYNILDSSQEMSRIIIYFSKNIIVFICRDEFSEAMLESKVKEYSSSEKVLSSFFIELLKYDMDNLENIEDKIFEFEDGLLSNIRLDISKEIVNFRRNLSLLKRYYEQLNSIFEELLENENDVIPKAHIRHFKVLDNRIDRLYLSVLHLQDYLSQVREAYQAQVDIEQNLIMKTFTVVTSIFLPLNLIVGWYGMNLKMPEFNWEYGYLYVICISISVLFLSFKFFNKKKWF